MDELTAVLERMVELCVEDKGLHDAIVRLINARARGQELLNEVRARRLLKKNP